MQTTEYPRSSKKRNRVIPLAASVACCWMLTSPPLAHANLLQNGSFESPDLVLDGLYGAVQTDWTAGAYVFRGALGGVWPAPQDGAQFVDIGFGSAYTLSQTFTLAVSGAYLLSWHDNAGNGFSHNYGVEIDASTEGTYSGTGTSAWTSRSLGLVLSAGSHTLTFVGGSGFDTLLDNVSLVADSTSAVPEAGSSLGFLGTALAGLGLLRRKRRSPLL